MKKLFTCMLLFYTCFTFAAAADDISRSQLVTAKEPANVYNNPDKTIMVSRDKPQFVIKLNANPTTGFSWFVKEYTHQVLTLEKQVYYPPKDMVPGRGGYTKFFFKVNSSAFHAAYVAKIELVYARPWDITKGKEVEFHIVTQNATENG